MTQVLDGVQLFEGPIKLAAGLTVSQDGDGFTVIGIGGGAGSGTLTDSTALGQFLASTSGGGHQWLSIATNLVQSLAAGTAISLSATTGAITVNVAVHDIISLHNTSGRTAGQLLRATSATALGWTTASYPTTIANGAILYATSTNNIGALAAGTVGQVIRSTGTVPAYATLVKGDLPSTIAYEDEANTFTQIQDFGSSVFLSQAAGNQRVIFWRSGTSFRWALYANSDAESGSNVGSTLVLSRYSDAGALIDSPISVSRSTGVVTLYNYIISGSGFYSGTTAVGFNESAGAGIFSIRAGTTDALVTVDVTNGLIAVNSVRTHGQLQLNTTAALIFDKNTHGHTYIYEATNDRMDFVMGGVTGLQLQSANATFGANVYAAYFKAGQGSNGYVTLQQGDVSNSGYVEWWSPSAVRQAYMGYSTAGGPLTLSLTAASHFIIDKDLVIGSLGRFDSADTPLHRDLMMYDSTAAKWRAETVQFTFGSSDIKNVITGGVAATFILVDPGSGSDTVGGAPPIPIIKTYPSHNSVTVHLSADAVGSAYAKPADFRYFETQISTDITFATGVTSNYHTSDKIVLSKLTNGTTYYVRSAGWDRAGNALGWSTTSTVVPVESELTAFGVIIAGEIGAISLSAINASLGDIVAGQVRNAANTAGFFVDVWPGASAPNVSWTRYISLVGTGSDKFIMHENFELRHDGLARLKSRTVRNTTGTKTASTTESVLHTHTIPGGYEGVNGGLHIIVYFSSNTGTTGNVTLRVRHGGLSGTVIASKTINVLNSGTAEVWLDVRIFNETVTTSGRASCLWVTNDGSVPTIAHQSGLSIVTASSHDIVVTAEHANTSIQTNCLLSVTDILPKD